MGLKSRRGGFTLIELLIVMVIVSLIAGFGIPMFARSMERAEVKGAAGEITALMRLARGRAIATREPSTVVVDAETRQAWVVAGKFEPEKNQRAVEGPVAIPQSVKLWTLGEKNVLVEFSPSGSSTTCELALTAQDAHAGNDENGYHILLEPLSGRARVAPNTELKAHEARE
ncbi:MAG: GspH/FimT family pseudopilin [Nitrospinae bacterium]|nr:GspH/FimT family pseudopilin [Nitrospinota bacterium]